MSAVKDFVKKWKQTKNVLGMNARNLKYIRPYNRAKAKRKADNKIITKKLLRKSNIPVSDTYAIIRSREEAESFDWSTLPNSFVLKPAHGFGGGGIVVVFNRNKRGNWVGIEGFDVLKEDLESHVYNILDGEFSLSNLPDVALFEERIRIHKIFKEYSYKGMPDVRLIVFNNVPVMAMLRFPTKQSGGRGNVTQGALGLGIDMATGVTTTAIKRNILTHFDTLIEYHTEKMLPLSGIKIPYWDEILRIGVECQKISGLGYLGVDVAIDKERGPLVMELNARPGLSIQNANNEGLEGRIKRVEGLKVSSTKRGMRLAKDLFGGEIEESVEETTGKKVIGSVELVKLAGKNNIVIEEKARIDTGAASTSICEELAIQLGFRETLEKFNEIDLAKYIPPEGVESQDVKKQLEIKEAIFKDYQRLVPDLSGVSTVFSANGMSIRPRVNIEYYLDEEKVRAEVNIVKRKGMKYSMLVGRKDLNRKYLVEVEE